MAKTEVVPLAMDKVIMTERATASDDQAVLVTGPGKADVQVVTLTGWQQAGIRAMRVYLQSLLGFLAAVTTGAAAGAGVEVTLGGFTQLFLSAATMAIAPAVISFCQNLVEILSRLDTSIPQVRA